MRRDITNTSREAKKKVEKMVIFAKKNEREVFRVGKRKEEEVEREKKGTAGK